MVLTVHLPEHNINGAENHDGVCDTVTAAHIFEDRQVDQARRADSVPVWIGRAVTDQIETELALRCLDPSISLARFWPEAPDLCLRVHDGAWRKIAQGLVENL